jgi:serine/threonine-protein kinase
VLRRSFSKEEEVVTRFFNEARAAAALSDPGIVQVYDFGHHTDGSAYLVMELLDGETLAARLERVGRLSINDALRLTRQVASSLGAAHARGIVHRDVKPENIFMTRDPEVPGGERAKILDFGIAKLFDDKVAIKTHTAALLGTPMFMSPEQCLGAGSVDQRTDIYSLGCVLYTAITGAPPFESDALGALLVKHVTEVPARPTERRADVPANVEALIETCMAKRPDKRFASGGALASAIDTMIPRESAAQIRSANAPGIEVNAEAMAVSAFARLLREPTTLSRSAMSRVSLVAPRRRGTGSVVAIGVALAVVGAPVACLSLRSASEDAVEPPSAPAATTPAEPQRTAVPARVTPEDLAKPRIVATLTAFRRWALDHPNAACPSHAELVAHVAGGVIDPWKHALVVTCTDQPANQMIGVISRGPDGIAGTADDIASWALGADVAAIARGERWAPPSRPTAKPTTKPTAKPTAKRATTTTHNNNSSFTGITLGDDGIPTTR